MSALLVEALLRCGLTPGERFSVAAIRDRTINAECFDRPEDANRFLDQRSGWNHYFCGNPLREGTRGKPKAADILEGRVLLLDADPDPDEAAARAAILATKSWLDEGSFEVCAVDSGRGAQLWVRTEPTLDIAGRERLGKWLSKKFARPGMKFDATFNLDRLMRLPGSVNLKTGRVASFL